MSECTRKSRLYKVSEYISGTMYSDAFFPSFRIATGLNNFVQYSNMKYDLRGTVQMPCKLRIG